MVLLNVFMDTRLAPAVMTGLVTILLFGCASSSSGAPQPTQSQVHANPEAGQAQKQLLLELNSKVQGKSELGVEQKKAKEQPTTPKPAP